jgi:hypothetical protein
MKIAALGHIFKKLHKIISNYLYDKGWLSSDRDRLQGIAAITFIQEGFLYGGFAIPHTREIKKF